MTFDMQISTRNEGIAVPDSYCSSYGLPRLASRYRNRGLMGISLLIIPLIGLLDQFTLSGSALPVPSARTRGPHLSASFLPK